VTPNVLLVNAARTFPPDRLAALAATCRVSVLTMPAFAHRYTGIETVQLVDSLYDLGQVQRAAAEVYRGPGLDHVLGPAERSVPATGLIRSCYGLPGYGFDTALVFSDKHRMKQALRAGGLPVTDWITVPTVHQVPDAVRALGGGRVVVKPVFGGGGQNTFVLDTELDAAELARSAAARGLRSAGCPVVVERFVPMSAEYHCDAVVHDGQVRFAAVCRYLDPMLEQVGTMSGAICVHGSPIDAAIQDLHRRTVAALGLTSGVTHLEVFETDAGLLVGEIACRPGGSGIPELVRLQHGVDLWQAFIDLSRDGEPRIDQVVPARTFALIDMPIRTGRVTALSSPQQLAAVPDVVEVDMQVAVGDTVEHLHTGTAAARLYLGLDRAEDLPERMQQLAERFEFSVEVDDRFDPVGKAEPACAS
jgi:biotin carboxylase